MNNTDDIEVSFLCQGCQRAEEVAQRLAGFINQATRTIDIAIYSFKLGAATNEIVVGALKQKAASGVAVRIAYDAATQQAQVPGYQPNPEDATEVQVKALNENPLAVALPVDTENFIKSLGLPCKPIEGYRALMHDKYVVIDNGTPAAQVWTGSSNWTDDSWTLQESNIIVLRSQEVAKYFTNDFNELWVDGKIETSGAMDMGRVDLVYRGQPAQVDISFAPTDGRNIDAALAGLIDGAKERVTLATVVLTSGKMLGALQQLKKRGVPLDGIYDATQMHGVAYQWGMVESNAWKIPAWQEIVDYGHLVGKHSTPYTPTSKHDFMHNKVMVVDNTVVTGSYNFSRHAQSNAENVLIIASQPLAQTYRDYIYTIMRQYGSTSAGPLAGASMDQRG